MGINTICTHIGEVKDEQYKGAISPLFMSNSYAYENVEVSRYPRYFNTPNQEALCKKIAALENIIKQFGYKLDTRDRKSTSNSLNNLLKEVQGRKEQNLVDTLAIRSMSKAVYTTQNIGHYGLAFDYYTHFTSPIRRYPDIMVHRLLNSYLEEAKDANEDQYEQKCRHSSEMEGLASQAERASIKYKLAELMKFDYKPLTND